MSRIRRFANTTLAAAILGFMGGCAVAIVAQSRMAATEAKYVPLPHHVPKYADGLAFRFAMAHDVIHERFPKHGPAYYRERNRLTREKLASLPPDDPDSFPLADDLGAGLDRLGESNEAVEILRDKLARQEAAGLEGRDLYTSYANLGTFLIHDSFKAAMAGDEAAKQRMREGLGFIRKSIEVNPEAHFGREQWQAAIVEYILTLIEWPWRLTEFDCIGNRWDTKIDSTETRAHGQGAEWAPFGHASRQWSDQLAHPDRIRDDETRSLIRSHISTVGAESGWHDLGIASHSEPVALDEPMLGIIGMWRQGGGANPHFALAIGETMLRVGQRYIAWAAFERAARMADRFWPDPAMQQALRDHCTARQKLIERTLSSGEVAELRPKFDEELAFGERYQREYQEYEAAKIAAGVPLDAPDFYAEFDNGRPPIASPPGPEEWYAYSETFSIPRIRNKAIMAFAWGTFGAGLAAFAAALYFRPRIQQPPPLPLSETVR